MPAFMKLGDIKGESQDAFVFKTVKADPPEFDPADDFGRHDGDGETKGLLLPAVQAFMDDGTEFDDGMFMEDMTLNYTEVEWTY